MTILGEPTPLDDLIPNRLPFEPIGLDTVSTLSESTRLELALDLARMKELERLRSMALFIPFLKTSKNALDVALCAHVLAVADEAWTEPLITRFEAIFQASRQLHHQSYTRNDFGCLGTALAMEALVDKLGIGENKPSAQTALGLSKAIRLARSSSLSTLSPLESTPNELPYGFLLLGEPIRTAGDLEFKRLGISSTRHTMLSVSLGIAACGDHRLLDAVLDQPECIDYLAHIALAEGGFMRDERYGHFKALHTDTFWATAPELGFKLIDRALEKNRAGLMNGCPPSLLHAKVVSSIIQAAQGDPAYPALRELIARSDVDFFCRIYVTDQPMNQFTRAMALACADDLYKPAFDKLMDVAFDMTQAIRGVDTAVRWRCLREALFSPMPGAAEMAQKAWARKTRLEPNPYLACLRSTNIEKHIEAICHCQRPEIATLGLDAIGLLTAQNFPGHRKGLDSSISMWIAHKAPLPIFQATLDWFEAQGGLLEQACSKAWVYQGHETRKKGDLLADCVARGNVEQARAVLAKLPDAETKSARDVARAMAQKVSGSAGGIALSSWETLLLGKVLQAHRNKIKSPSEPELPKRSHRL
jgi:hypothetical protein